MIRLLRHDKNGADVVVWSDRDWEQYLDFLDSKRRTDCHRAPPPNDYPMHVKTRLEYSEPGPMDGGVGYTCWHHVFTTKADVDALATAFEPQEQK